MFAKTQIKRFMKSSFVKKKKFINKKKKRWPFAKSVLFFILPPQQKVWHIIEMFKILKNCKWGKMQEIYYLVVRNWAKFVQTWITSWHLRQELKGRVKINFQKWATYFTSKTRKYAHDQKCDKHIDSSLPKEDKCLTSRGGIFLPIFEGKGFEGLGSLGSGRCVVQPSQETAARRRPCRNAPSTPSLAQYHGTWSTCTSLYISALVGCIKNISGAWGWMRLGLVRMSTSSVGPNLLLMNPLHDEVSHSSVSFPLVLSLTGKRVLS